MIRKSAILAWPMAVLVAFGATPLLAQESGGAAIEEVIVTAQKREQNLQAVGVSVTALGSEALANGGVTDISRLELLTPGVTCALARRTFSEARSSTSTTRSDEMPEDPTGTPVTR